MISMHWPWVLLLLPLPWIIRRLLPARLRPQAALRIPGGERWQQLPGAREANPPTEHWRGALLALLWLALLTSLARPYWQGEPVALPVAARDLLLAVDISGSMAREDMVLNGQQASRLAAVKSVLDGFINERKGDRLGLVLFGANAYVQAPLTFDRETIRTYLNEAQIGLAGKETAIGDAIGLAIKRLLNHPAESRVLVLLTDGANTAGEVDPRKAAALAADNSVKVYTVALGADTMQVPGFFGSRTVNPSSDLDEDLLRDIASQTGGAFFRARNLNELQQIYQLIDQLEPTDKNPQTWRPQQSLYHWPLALVWLLALALLLDGQWASLRQRLQRNQE